MTKRETQLAELESELRLSVTKNRKRDLRAMITEVKKLMKGGK